MLRVSLCPPPGLLQHLVSTEGKGPPPSLWTAACREGVLLPEAFLNYHSGADGSPSPHKLDQGLLSPPQALGPLSASYHPALACCAAEWRPAFSREKCHFFADGGAWLIVYMYVLRTWPTTGSK